MLGLILEIKNVKKNNQRFELKLCPIKPLSVVRINLPDGRGSYILAVICDDDVESTYSR